LETKSKIFYKLTKTIASGKIPGIIKYEEILRMCMDHRKAQKPLAYNHFYELTFHGLFFHTAFLLQKPDNSHNKR